MSFTRSLTTDSAGIGSLFHSLHNRWRSVSSEAVGPTGRSSTVRRYSSAWFTAVVNADWKFCCMLVLSSFGVRRSGTRFSCYRWAPHNGIPSAFESLLNEGESGISNRPFIYFGIPLSRAWSSEAVAKESGDRAGHEEEHGAGEEEAVGDPLVVEKAGVLRV